MSKADPDAVKVYAARTISRQLADLRKELEGAVDAEDIEFVHRSRVASRRLRASLSVFEDCLPKGKRKEWKKGVHQVTSSLGEARDLDVQIEFLRGYIDRNAGDASLHRLLSSICKKRTSAQEQIERSIEQLERSELLKDIDDWADRTDDGEDIDLRHVRRRAADSMVTRIDDVLAFDRFVADPNALVKHHEMRIAGKHLRYAAEIFSRGYEGGLKNHIKRLKEMQEMLGEMHDCDMWSSLLRNRKGAGAQSLLEDRRSRRGEVHSKFVSFWKEMKEHGLPDLMDELKRSVDGGKGSEHWDGTEEDLVRSAVVLATEHDRYDDHAKHVRALSMKLFEKLGPELGLDGDSALLECAAVMHDIGWSGGGKGHHKRSFDLIMASGPAEVPFKERLIIANVARYHRGAVPKETHANLKRLDGKDVERMSKMASILRIADGLDYGHRQKAVIEDVTIGDGRLDIILKSAEGCDAEISSAIKKSDLFAKITGMTVVIS